MKAKCRDFWGSKLWRPRAKIFFISFSKPSVDHCSDYQLSLELFSPDLLILVLPSSFFFRIKISFSLMIERIFALFGFSWVAMNFEIISQKTNFRHFFISFKINTNDYFSRKSHYLDFSKVKNLWIRLVFFHPKKDK